MNRFHALILVVLTGLSVALVSCNDHNEKFNDIVEYNDSLIDALEMVTNDSLKFLDKMDFSDTSQVMKLEEYRQELLKTITASEKRINGYGDYDNDSTLRMAALDLCSFYRSMINNEVKQMFDTTMGIARATEPSASSVTFIETVVQTLDTKEKAAMARWRSAHRRFANEHDYKIQDNAGSD